MYSYLYLVDFGEVVKIGVSNNPDKRIESISKNFGLKPLTSVVHETLNAVSMESKVKYKFKADTMPFKRCLTETFNVEFSIIHNFVNGLIVLDDPSTYDDSKVLDPNKEVQKGFMLKLTKEQKAKLQQKANKKTDGNLTKLLQNYADE